MKWQLLKRPLLIACCVFLVELFFDALSLIQSSTAASIASCVLNSICLFVSLGAFFLAWREERNAEYTERVETEVPPHLFDAAAAALS